MRAAVEELGIDVRRDPERRDRASPKRTGARCGNRKAYFGDYTPGSTDKLDFPSCGADAAQLLVNE